MPGAHYKFGPSSDNLLFSLSETGVLSWLQAKGKGHVNISEPEEGVLRCMLKNAHRPVSYRELIIASNPERGNSSESVNRSSKAKLTSIVFSLRQKLRGHCPIAPERGVGYKVNWHVEANAGLEDVWEHLQEECDRRTQAFLGTLRTGSGHSFYVPRDAESSFWDFLTNTYTAMAIIGESGVGKTTMVAHLACEWSRSGYLCAVFPVAELHGNRDGIRKTLAGRLGVGGPLLSWKQINAVCTRHETKLILFLDAVNEFNESMSYASSAASLMLEINEFVSRLHQSCHAVKVVITCRPEVWRRGTTSSTEFDMARTAYFPAVSGVRLVGFSEAEVERAYENYRVQRNIQTKFTSLSALARLLLREPFLLDLATEAYAGQEFPRDMDTAAVFVRYIEDLKKKGLANLVHCVVQDFFTHDDGAVVPGVLQRASIDLSVRKRDQDLYNRLFTSSVGSDGSRLLEERVLLKTATASSEEVRFNYDRIAEYLISNKLSQHIDERREHGGTTVDAVADVIIANLLRAEKMSVALGALQQTLSGWLQRCSADDYAAILKRIAAHDVRGLNLVISAIVRAARSSEGLEIMTKVLRSLEPGKGFETFPVMYAVYRIVSDEAYNTWLKEQGSLRSAHQALLHGYFEWGFRHPSEDVSNVAVLYLFFLWRSESRDDAVAATHLIVGNVDGLLKLRDDEYRIRLTNLTGLMIMLLAETQGQSFEEVWSVTRSLLSRLHLRENKVVKAVELLGDLPVFGKLTEVMVGYLLSVLNSLHNPINARELERFYQNRKDNLPYYEQIVEFLMGDCDPRHLEKFAMPIVLNEQSFTFQMLTFALSVSWHRSESVTQSERCMRTIKDLAESGNPIALYCASLALYHINCFSKKHNDDTMDTMHHVALKILEDWRGQFYLRDIPYNFNIIGTYGKALHLHRAGSGAQGGYAREVLERARSSEEPAFYIYVCENIGLLGVLISLPLEVRSVLSEILIDLGLIGGSVRQGRMFSDLQLLKTARKTIQQSLANIRAIHREFVDHFLVEHMEKVGGKELYSKVAGHLTPRFKLATFHSWAFEQLMFRVLTEHREEVGMDILKAFRLGAQKRSTNQCIWAMVKQFLEAMERAQI